MLPMDNCLNGMHDSLPENCLEDILVFVYQANVTNLLMMNTHTLVLLTVWICPPLFSRVAPLKETCIISPLSMVDDILLVA